MHTREKSRSHFREACLGIVLTFALLLGAMASALPVKSQTIQTIPVFTNIAQITLATDQTNGLIGNVKLNATVFACSTNSGALALQDDSGACLLELDGLERGFLPGDRVEIEGNPSFLRASGVGVYVCAAPTLDDDGLHPMRATNCQCFFEAGRYPLRLDWFNQIAAFGLDFTGGASDSRGQPSAQATAQTMNLIHAVHAECFQGFWKQLPNFQLLQPVKIGDVSNFDISFRTRDDMVGIRFDGYFDAPRSGYYRFILSSDDGSRLWIGNTAVPVKKLGMEAVPVAPLAVIGQPMRDLNEHRLATLEGRVDFVSRLGKGLQFELRSDQDSLWIDMADAGDLDPVRLLNAYVRVSGVAGAVLTESQRIVLGKLAVVSSKEMSIIESASGKGTVSPLLKMVIQVHSLSSDDAARHLAVKLRGVVTAMGYGQNRWMVLQDDTRGIFISRTLVTNCIPNVGEIWSISGHTEPGNFAPVIIAEQATLLGKGRLPEPAHPDWNQLMNGSMDVQWVELQGLVTGVQSNGLSLLLPEGQLEIELPDWEQAELESFNKAVVHIRGTLFAVWNAQTHEVQSGSIRMEDAIISVDKPEPADPFDAPEKTPRGLFRFDVKATPFQRVKVRGQVTYAGANRVFLEADSGIEILPVADVNLREGDWVEAVGYPEISGDSPLLHHALLRKVRDGRLPEARLLSDSELADTRFVFTRVRIEGKLVGQYVEENAPVLQIQTSTHLFLARLKPGTPQLSLRSESRLQLTGVYSQRGDSRHPAETLELLLNSPAGIRVLSQPSWWTLERLVAAVSVLMLVLLLAAAWITQLRRQVEQRTAELRKEIRQREHAERQHAIEAERSRIARDLHDDLGSGLSEINLLVGARQQRSGENGGASLFQIIASKTRGLIAALDVIVWAVDPEDNSLQSLADYLNSFVAEFLSHSGITCRLKVPIIFPAVMLDGQVRHDILMAVKEAINNVVRHSEATEVEFRVATVEGTLEIGIADNGRGFDTVAQHGGRGVKNLSTRLTNLGGSCQVESATGHGTTVKIRLPLNAPTLRTPNC